MKSLTEVAGVSNKTKFRVAITAAATLGLVAMVPVGASAEELAIDGYTESTFVAAAVEQGVDPALAEEAWGDTTAMAAIPVASDSFAGVSGLDSSDAGLAARAATAASGTCYKTWNNAFGFEILRVTLDKQWTYDGSTISSPAAQFYAQAGAPYVYDEQVGSEDFYSTAYDNPQGTHTSYRQGKFSESLSGTSVNASVTMVSQLAGNYSCSYGGGV